MATEPFPFSNGLPNPLEGRLGKAFFDALPTDPGVYLMYSPSGRLLYVGKAKNLRSRLFSYRRIKDGNGSRKEQRLVKMIADIKFIVCESEEAALLKENKLIRDHRPDFNLAKKRPEKYYFLNLQTDADALHFKLLRQIPVDEAERLYTYGSFKGPRRVRKGVRALLRQLYLLENDVTDAFQIPMALAGKRTPENFEIPIQSGVIFEDGFQQSLHAFLGGESPEFLQQIVSIAQDRKLFSSYIGKLILDDCNSLKRLYTHNFQRNRALVEKLGLKERLIPQNRLDDLLVQATFMDS